MNQYIDTSKKILVRFFNKNDFDYTIRTFSDIEHLQACWKQFILEKDLGIDFVKCDFMTKEIHYYDIIDERKWLLNKIKYGF
jgi:hypothetical protein